MLYLMLKNILQFHLSIGDGKPKFPLKNNKRWKDKNKKHNQKIVSHNDSLVASILKIEINKGINYALASYCHQVFKQLSHLYISQGSCQNYFLYYKYD